MNDPLIQLFAELEQPGNGESFPAFLQRLQQRLSKIRIDNEPDARLASRLNQWATKFALLDDHDEAMTAAFRAGVWYAILCLQEAREHRRFVASRPNGGKNRAIKARKENKSRDEIIKSQYASGKSANMSDRKIFDALRRENEIELSDSGFRKVLNLHRA